MRRTILRMLSIQSLAAFTANITSTRTLDPSVQRARVQATPVEPVPQVPRVPAAPSAPMPGVILPRGSLLDLSV